MYFERMAQHYPAALLYASLAAAAALGVLMPAGDGWAHLLFVLCAACAAAAIAPFGWARAQERREPRLDPSLRPDIEWWVIRGSLVPGHLLEGNAPLVALVEEGQVPHPELAATLTPYFAEPTLAFVQGATRYDGDGGVADSYRLLAHIGDAAQAARERAGAAALFGSGALISREALRQAWRPGITWEVLGMRLAALGYTGRFEPRPMVLAWAPRTLQEYGGRLAAHTRTSLPVAWRALVLHGLTLETRLQYLGAAAAPLAIWTAAACGLLSSLSLIAKNAGPVILTSPVALPMLILALACIGVVAVVWYKLAAINPARPLALAFVGAYAYAWHKAKDAATGPRAKGLWGSMAHAARLAGGALATAAATARAGGNAGTSPAGTPARS